jgi:DNA repair photolyase/predicted SprT family Zn-dependent metalloprotease
MEQPGKFSDILNLHPAVSVQGSVDEATMHAFQTEVNWIDNKSILTPTSGFLEGYTHTLNPYVGCSNAHSICGTYCYAQHQHWIVRGRAWGLYGAKRNIRNTYQRDFDRLKHPRHAQPKPLRVYMSSSTDPYLPQEKKLCLTQAILEEMQNRPPDVLVIQTHTTLISRDFDLIRQLAEKCELWVSITVETDMDHILGFPPHPSKPAQRIETLKRFREAGVQTQATISPLLPIADPQQFAQALNTACDRVIIDHYEYGDGSHGARTRRTNFPQLLDQAGFGEWNDKNKLWEIRDILAGVLGEARVLVSAAGFNAVGQAQTVADPVPQPETPNFPLVITMATPVFVSAAPTASIHPVAPPSNSRLNDNSAPQNVYESLKKHQEETSEPLAVLHSYLPRIVERFYGQLPLPALSWGISSPGNLGWYVEKDGLSLNHRINLNSMYADRTLGEILRTLTHEIGHQWQYIHGKPGKHRYHNKEFQQKMEDIGIPCNDRGHSLGMQEPFISFLRDLDVDADATPFKKPSDDETQPKTKPGSRLKPWACHCTRVWASVGTEVEALCTKCGNHFERSNQK